MQLIGGLPILCGAIEDNVATPRPTPTLIMLMDNRLALRPWWVSATSNGLGAGRTGLGAELELVWHGGGLAASY